MDILDRKFYVLCEAFPSMQPLREGKRQRRRMDAAKPQNLKGNIKRRRIVIHAPS